MVYESISFRFHNFTISADYTYILYNSVEVFFKHVGLNGKNI